MPIYGFDEKGMKRVVGVVRAVEKGGGRTGDPPRRRTVNRPLIDAIPFVISNGGHVIPTGIVGYLEIPFSCGIVAARMVADQACTATVDVWMDTYAHLLPTNADSITAAAPLAIVAGIKDEDTTLTGWTTAIPAGNWLVWNVDANDNATLLTISLTVVR